MQRIAAVLVFIFFVSATPHPISYGKLPNERLEQQVPLDHSAWDLLLKKYVDAAGNVAYEKFAADSPALAQYLSYLTKNAPLESWTRQEKLAYYINLYNAATVKLILDHYPLKSIKELKSPWGSKVVPLGKDKISLGHLEHRILRKMDDPRIHFAINCASYSCPKLLNEAFISATIDTQLNKAARDFINDPSRNQLSGPEVSLSQIFNWYKKDFTKDGSLIAYINRYSSKVLPSDTKFSYLKYNWALNEKQ
ncbi:DUF547 domain-containing protein [Arenibacter sp. 6A1]|uniref:DUF547 domain-containing protein n=1 Tax=Arenibacter sp. 6A1 TaxID=2720391 RepID=UPI001446DE4B|nr:DUF547 domain-containing protein [Arenibacter sp. 6A1]NKI26081.1 DUF547 domain-containing protein [Arenibacter sp. 6A1]